MNSPKKAENRIRLNDSGLLKTSNVLNDLIRLTEEKYAYVYECLPASEQEIKVIIREAEILLDYLIYNSGFSVSAEGNSVVIEALAQARKEFETVTDTFLNKDLTEVLLRTFLDDSGTEEQSFSELSRLAVEVNDTLASLRDLALNSMIFSIRVGSEGAGFQILSDRINQVSSGLSERFANMNSTIEELNCWNQDFQIRLKDFVEYEENLKTKYQHKFKEEFTKIELVLKKTCDCLNDHLDNVRDLNKIVPEAMVLIQDQDIIRQNIENLIKCLQIVLEKKETLVEGEGESILNYVVFAKKVAELAEVLVENIEAGLAKSLMTLEEVLERLDREVDDLEEEACSLGRFFAGVGIENPAEFNVMDDVFTKIIGQVVDLLYIKKHIENKSNLLLEGKNTFVRLMEDVDSDFDLINHEIRTLKKMRVLLKIELARINFGRDNSMQNIVEAVDQVIETVNNNQMLFARLRRYFIQNLEEFGKALDTTRCKLTDSSRTLELSGKKLRRSHQLVKGAVQAMLQGMADIFSQLKEPYKNLQVMEQVKTILDDTRQEIGSYNCTVGEQMAELFQYYGIEEWEEKEEDLKAVLDQFTCYVERKSAHWVFEELEADVDSHSNDIVLF